MDLIRTVRTLLGQLERRVLLMIGRAVLTVIDDSTRMQSLQLRGLSTETLDTVERFQNYGFTSHPHPGAEALLVSLGGMRQHPVAVAVDDRRHRVKDLARGEVCLYTDEDEEGKPHRVFLRRGRVARIECGGSSIVVAPGGIQLVTPGAVSVQSASLTHNSVNVGDDHVHSGVRSGPATTGAPQ